MQSTNVSFAFNTFVVEWLFGYYRQLDELDTIAFSTLLICLILVRCYRLILIRYSATKLMSVGNLWRIYV